MKHKGVFVLAMALAGCIENELPIPVREPGNAEIRYADLGPDYGVQLHVNLHTGEVVANHPKDAWCTRFHFKDDTVWMDLNSSRFMHIAPIGQDMSNVFLTPGQADALSWGVNRPSGRDDSQIVQAGLTWAIDLGRDPDNPIASLGSVRMECLDADSDEAMLRVSELVSEQPDDTLSWDTIWVANDPDISQVHLSLLHGEANVVNIEPPTGTWDLYFTQYTALLGDEGEEPTTEYLVTGVLSHAEGIRVLQPLDGDWEHWKEVDWSPQDWSEDWDILGFDWKSYSLTEGTYSIDSDAIYCISTPEGREFLFRFLDFYDDTGATGRITYETLER